MKELFKLSINNDREQLKEQHKLLESTKGYQGLSEKQKRLIKASLYLQERAERSTDSASAQAIESKKQGYYTDVTRIHHEDHLKDMQELYPGFYKDPELRKYRKSQNRIVDSYCHAAIYDLEHEEDNTIELKDIPDDFFKADYKHVQDIEDVRSHIASFGFPCVVHVSQDNSNFNDGLHQKHSFLALGENESGDIVLWEKMGNGLPFRVAILSQVYKDYKTDPYWGVRKLASKLR